MLKKNCSTLKFGTPLGKNITCLAFNLRENEGRVEFVLNIWDFSPYLTSASGICMRFGETNRKQDLPQI